MSMKMLTTLVRSNDVEFGYSRVAMEEHNLLLRSDSFQSEHVQTAAAMERGGDPASEKCCHIHLMCIQSMRHNKQQWPAWLLKACWMQAEDNSCLDTTMAALSLNPFFTLKKKKNTFSSSSFFFFTVHSLHDTSAFHTRVSNGILEPTDSSENAFQNSWIEHLAGWPSFNAALPL